MPQRLTILFGGSFDPPHVGHVLAVAWLLSAYDADVWVEPVNRHVLGKTPPPFLQRKQWCELAFGIFGARVEVRDDECRAGASGTTIDLVRHLRARYPQRAFRLAIGTDILHERHRWQDFPGLVALCPLIILPRPGYPVPEDVVGEVAPVTLPDVSSSGIRVDLARRLSGADPRPVQGLVPAAVLAALQDTSKGDGRGPQ